MKKFVSMAMVAAMTASMVPATAFAGDDLQGTAKVVNKLTNKDTDAKEITGKDVPELQIKLTDAATQSTNATTNIEFTVTLDNADFYNATAKAIVDEDALNKKMADETADEKEVKTYFDVIPDDGTYKAADATVTVQLDDTNEATVKVSIPDGKAFGAGDIITMDLVSVLDKAKNAYVAVESDDITISNDSEDMVYVAIEDEGITASVKKLAKVAEEEITNLEKDLKIESTVGNFEKNQKIELKLSNGFEFTKKINETPTETYSLHRDDDDKITVTVLKAGLDEIVIDADDIEIEATSAKEGAVAKLTVKALNNVKGAFKATTTVEVVEVTDYNVVMSVDEDEDVPVFYSGVDANNTGITDDADHVALEVTIEETFPGAWNLDKGFNLELPEGVYVTAVDVTGGETALEKGGKDPVEDTFEDAYQEGEHKGFEFGKRVFAETVPGEDKDGHELTFELTLVADPTFVGDVNLKLTGDAVDEQEVTIATFMPIAVVEAEQNDMKIDYRYTEVPSTIVVKETEAGLWKEGTEFWMAVDKASYIEFEDGATFEVTGGLEIDDFEEDRFSKSADEKVNSIGFEIEEESDEAATVTISDMSLFMQRNIPAGPYDLTAGGTAFMNYHTQKLFAEETCDDDHGTDCDCHIVVDDVCDYSDVVKEAFINVVTAGREQDDASFTTKVVVPVGESYIVSGETTVELDVPAYVSEAGYTMLPVRAVAKALGINNNNVMWDGATKTVTILYGQRIITMVAGQKAINVNGSVIPASAAVEIVEGRTFLPMRDLATALGVTDIAWDASTKTATLNGGQAE